MNAHIRISLFAMLIALLVLASAFTVIPARADNGAPPPAPAPSGASTKTANTPSVLSNVPSGTNVIVADRSGHKAALASQQAADIIASGDPVWCPSGVAPTPGAGPCTALTTSFNTPVTGLLALIVGEPVNGTVWIESSPTYTGSLGVEGGPVTFDATLLSTSTHALTLNGGWSGSSGSTVLDPTHPSVFNVPLTITGWTSAVTLNNITISGAAGTGLTVSTTGNIVLNNVDATSNTGQGANLDNSSGAGTVTVNYSTFTDNTGGDGLQVTSKRAISAINLTADHNSNNGVYLNNGPASSAQPVTVAGVNNFSFNSNAGLVIYSNGVITVGNTTAIYNTADDGAYLDNCAYNATTSLCENPRAYAVTLKGSNNFSNNGFDGLEVWASGPITANNLTADDNGSNLNPTTTAFFGMGAYFDNFGAPAPQPLTLTGFNTFNGNGATGVWLDSSGLVSSTNVTANKNGLNANCLPSWICDGLDVPFADPTGFVLRGYGIFNGNGDDGMDAEVFGSISLVNLTAAGNGYWGVMLDNCQLNTSTGVCESHGNVAVGGTNVFTDNQYTGLTVNSSGTVTLNNLTSSNNGLAANAFDGSGVYVENCFFDNVVTNKCDVTVPRSVILNGANTFNGNFADGLLVDSSGALTVNQVTAGGNGADGAFLDNQWGGKSFNLTLTGINVFTGNTSLGLEAYSNGSILLNNITADENKGSLGAGADASGAYLDNISTTLVPVSITLTGMNTFNDNGLAGVGTGLVALSDGAITINSLTANNNQEYGAVLDNASRGTLPRNITLTGVNNLINNRQTGLVFHAKGSASLVQITSDQNTLDGILGTAAVNISIKCGSMFQNGSSGYDLTGTIITLRGVFSGLNGSADTTSTAPVVFRDCPIP